MDRTKASKEIMELFTRLVIRYNALEKFPVKLSSKHDLYHSERHMLDKIGDHPGINLTEFAKVLGVTKGAVSQVVKKLEAKGVVKRYKKGDNEKEIFLELTKSGQSVYLEHKRTNEETVTGPMLAELEKYPDEKVQFLINMFKWIDGFLEQSERKMKNRV
jgi:DNA-binding MarR family transcriptional regulator